MSDIQTQKFTLPIAGLLDVQEEWKVSMSAERDPMFSFTRTHNVAYRREDSFKVRAEFLNVRTPEDALRFFRYYGPFQITPREGSEKKRGPGVRVEPVRWSLFQRAQEDFKEALLAEGIPAEKRWLYDFVFGRPLMIELWFEAVMPAASKSTFQRAVSNEDAAIAQCNDVVDALRASIFLTRMGDFKWKRCSRPGCDQIFMQTHGRQMYCDISCAHSKAQSDYEAREKKKSLKKSPRVGRAKRQPSTKGKQR